MTGTSKRLSPFTVMIKPVGSLCNMSCSYCYYRKDNSNNGIMSYEMLELLTKQYIDASEGPVVNFTWHGGEPTLAGLDFFSKAVELQKKYLPKGWSCWNNLQTNGLLLDDSWCEFLSANKFDVGLSIDGNIHCHDYFRKDNEGEGTYTKVAETVKRLMSYGVKPDLLCTVNSVTVKEPQEVYKALKEFSTGWIQFIPIVNSIGSKVAKESTTAKEYGKFLSNIFDYWILHDFDTVGIQYFFEILRISSGGSASVCYMAPFCGRAVVVEHDGNVYSCDHFVNNDNLLGNIYETQLLEIVNDEKQYSFGMKKETELEDRCKECKWLKYCHGGCPKDRILTQENGKYQKNYLCEGYIEFFSYIEPVVELVTTLKKQNKSSKEIMVILQDEMKRIWKNIGRNDPCPCGSGKKAKNCCWYKRM